MLYTPEDFDPDKKYPMLVVFYETNSEELYRHYTMEPSWSWVNYPFYVSRGYMVFVPDVHYAPGIPGESAYNYICSGVEELCKERPWIDKERIGIDGQSWGGYGRHSSLLARTCSHAQSSRTCRQYDLRLWRHTLGIRRFAPGTVRGRPVAHRPQPMGGSAALHRQLPGILCRQMQHSAAHHA